VEVVVEVVENLVALFDPVDIDHNLQRDDHQKAMEDDHHTGAVQIEGEQAKE
jgi:hypothetical protein